ncbi:MAG: winged helix-turn-helix transcriptional regulator [Acidianus sp.]|jgi:predicted transcriptional regulator
MDAKDKVMSSEIKSKIVLVIKREGGKLSFKDIKDLVGVSTDTLKLQLADLVADGVIKKCKGKYELTEIGEEIGELLLKRNY